LSGSLKKARDTARESALTYGCLTHLHAFVGLDDRKIDLAEWMKSLKNTLSKALRFDGIAAPYWQKDFFDHVLRSEESYEEKWHYVRENPVRAGLVKQWQNLRVMRFGGHRPPLQNSFNSAAQPPTYDRGRCASRRAFCGRSG
jgi:hypothetical protein